MEKLPFVKLFTDYREYKVGLGLDNISTVLKRCNLVIVKTLAHQSAGTDSNNGIGLLISVVDIFLRVKERKNSVTLVIFKKRLILLKYHA